MPIFLLLCKKYYSKRRYEKSHWDDAIHDYRETEKNRWDDKNSIVVDRLRDVAFQEGSTTPLSHTHILDLSAQGSAFTSLYLVSINCTGN